jgi:hypothetical protein
MPRRAATDLLPELVRADLNSRLIASGFSGYEQLAEWLESKGFVISRSALHRYGQKFEDRCAALKLATDQAKAIVAEAGDDEGAMNEALIRLVQEKSFNLLMDLQIDPEVVEFPKLVRAIADVGRTGIKQKEWAAKARQQALDDVAKKVEELQKGKDGKHKLDAATLKRVREEIYGLSPNP